MNQKDGKIVIKRALRLVIQSLFGAIFLLAIFNFGWAAPVDYKEVKTIPLYNVLKTQSTWHVTAFEAEIEGTQYPFDRPAAKICFWHNVSQGKQQCIESAANHVKYQSIEQLSLIPLQKRKQPKYGVVFIARNLNPSLGKVRLISIWAYNAQSETFSNLLPTILLTDISEFKVFTEIGVQKNTIIVTADRLWSGSDPLYGAKHRFKIELYRYSEQHVMFNFIGGYETKKSYEVIDSMANYGVIKSEMGNIQKYLSKTFKED